MEVKPIVSIVMPAYNVEHFIGATITSILNQTYADWELLVVDDCSTDGTLNIVNTFEEQYPQIRSVKLQKNRGGPAAPRNIGVEQAKGRWIALLDADDIWHPRKLEFQMETLYEMKAKFCSTQMANFSNDEAINFGFPNNIGIEKITFSRQLRRYRTPTSSVVLMKELLILHPFNDDSRYNAREDFDCWLRIHEHIDYSIKLLFPFLYYRIVRGQISGSKMTMMKRTLLVLSEYRLKSGKSLGWRKYLYITTHIIYSIYFRLIKKSL